jgi:hypothetical protein
MRVPCFTPDGKAILYTSNLTADSNLHLVEICDFEELLLIVNALQK